MGIESLKHSSRLAGLSGGVLLDSGGAGCLAGYRSHRAGQLLARLGDA